MKESRRIFKAEFEILLDQYRLDHGDRERLETSDYLFTQHPGMMDVHKLPEILRRVKSIETQLASELPQLRTDMDKVDNTATTLVAKFEALKAGQAKEWQDVTKQMQVELDTMNAKVNRLQTDTQHERSLAQQMQGEFLSKSHIL